MSELWHLFFVWIVAIMVKNNKQLLYNRNINYYLIITVERKKNAKI